MADTTTIEWTRNDDGTPGRTWNPVTGCTKISAGCDNCYAETIAERFRGQAAFPKGFDVQIRADKVNAPLTWRKPTRVFVNSMSDLFHDEVDREWIAEIFGVMAAARKHTFQLLTKRHGRMRSLLNDPNFAHKVRHRAQGKGLAIGDFVWPLPNLWLGVSVENQKWADIRIPALLDTPAAVRFLSCEPLLGPVDITKFLGDLNAAEAPRGRRVLGSPDGGADDRRAGSRLEDLRPQRGAPHPLHTTPSGERHRGVLAGSSDEERHQVSRPGAPSRLEALQGTNTGWSDREPQERREVGQPAGELGAGDPLRAAGARPAGSTAGSAGPVGASQCHGEADFGASGADQGQASEGRIAEVHRPGLPSGDAAHLSDYPGRPKIAWLIVGGESGRNARPMAPQWATSLRDQCEADDVPFFFKQWGEYAPTGYLVIGGTSKGTLLAGDPVDDLGHRVELARVGKKKAGRELDGRTWDEFPKAVPQ